MSFESHKIGLMLPTYKEDQNIGDVLKEISKSAPGINVLVVDDSPDNKTADAARATITQLAATSYKVLKRVGARGRASAVREGFRVMYEEGCDYIIEMDTDGSHPPSQLPELIDTAIREHADIVICSRDVPGSRIDGWPFARHLLHFCANSACRTLLRLGIRDYMNAYRIFSRPAVKIMLEESGKISVGFWAFGETLVHIKMRGGIVKEIPTHFVNRTRGTSSVRLKVIVLCFLELLEVFALLCRWRVKPFEPSPETK